MFALGQRSRRLCVCLAMACFVTAGATTPRAARSAAPFSPFTQPLERGPMAIAVSSVPVRRDPFAGAPRSDALPTGGALLATKPLPPSAPSARRANADPTERVNAVVTGSRPYALVTRDGASRIVSLGDSYEGRRVIGITLDGLQLADGSVIRVAASEEPMLR
jgi:hypothetical protein